MTGRPKKVPDHIPSGRRPIFTSGPLTCQSSKVARRGVCAWVTSAQSTSPVAPGFWPGLPAGTIDIGTGTVGWEAASMVAHPATASASATRRGVFIPARYGARGARGQPGRLHSNVDPIEFTRSASDR